MVIEVSKQDILSCNVDVIVNPANPQLLKGGGLSGIIHDAAGDELFQYLKNWKRENRIPALMQGQAIVSPSFMLRQNYIIHAIGSVWREGSHEEKKILAKCYLSCLSLADDLALNSIAFPNMSTGIYGFPKDIAAEIAIDTVNSYKPENLTKVVFACYDSENYDLYKRAYE